MTTSASSGILDGMTPTSHNDEAMRQAIEQLERIEYPQPSTVQDFPRPMMDGASGDAVTIAFQHVRRRRAPECDVDDPRQRLWTLAALASVAWQAQASYAAVVDQARSLGATWEQVGQALGMTKQAAHERFSQ